MSDDEPLFCPTCGAEVCRRYCECCGLVPGEGKHCHFYGPKGNKTGCEA